MNLIFVREVSLTFDNNQIIGNSMSIKELHVCEEQQNEYLFCNPFIEIKRNKMVSVRMFSEYRKHDSDIIAVWFTVDICSQIILKILLKTVLFLEKHYAITRTICLEIDFKRLSF